ncbi:MAG: hypothetical protein ACLTSZ_08015 [Lachnospiraceae bacterium]
MLSNEKFVSKAPAVQDGRGKAKLEKYTQMMDQVKERLSQLQVKGKLQVLKVIGPNNMRAEGSVIHWMALPFAFFHVAKMQTECYDRTQASFGEAHS